MEKKVLTEEELQTLKGYQQRENNIVFSFGQIEYQIASLESQKDDLIETKQKFEEERIKFAKVLTERYGDGNINLETGEIISNI